MENNYTYHAPVLAKECIEALQIQPNGIYVDATFGGGGHSKLILEQLKEGKLIVFDRDTDAIDNIPQDPRVLFVNHNYAFIQNFLDYLEIDEVHGILADLGISSHQIDTPDRGFAHRFDGPLDMRMSQKGELTAAKILNTYSKEELAKLFRIYGEMQGSGKIAYLICNARNLKPIETTADLKNILEEMVPMKTRGKFWSQLYQALRIEVNGELEGLKKLLIHGAEKLAKGCPFVVMSYHSLEDRLVKNFFATGNFDGEIDTDIYGQSHSILKPLNRKGISPSEIEIAQNNRARSAKLRVAVKQ
jgi:16S rRNA (cytosine1402-N4)-methyltransferase